MKIKKIIFTEKLEDTITEINSQNIILISSYELYVVYKQFENVFYFSNENEEYSLQNIFWHISNILMKFNLTLGEVEIDYRLSTYRNINTTKEKDINVTEKIEQQKNRISKLENIIAKNKVTIESYKKRKSIQFFNKVGRMLRGIRGVKK